MLKFKIISRFKKFKVGDILIANNPCIMDNDIDRPTLTIGKSYVITQCYQKWGFMDNSIIIIDDEGDHHSFDNYDLEKYFDF